MNIGDEVEIIDTNDIWEGKTGTIENINNDIVTVYVNFNVEENKRIRQDFNINNLRISDDNISETLKREYIS